jgi:hypothetical protein
MMLPESRNLKLADNLQAIRALINNLEYYG